MMHYIPTDLSVIFSCPAEETIQSDKEMALRSDQ